MKKNILSFPSKTLWKNVPNVKLSQQLSDYHGWSQEPCHIQGELLETTVNRWRIVGTLPLHKGGEGLSFLNFQKGGGPIFPTKKEGLVKLGGIFILTSPFQCYLSMSLWCLCVCVCVYVCVFCIFTPFLSALLVFYRKNLVL